jgi:hypothetical protein
MDEIIFEVNQAIDGGFIADCLTEAISTQAHSWDELRKNVKKAVAEFYFDRVQGPERVRLHLVRDEILVQPRRSVQS